MQSALFINTLNCNATNFKEQILVADSRAEPIPYSISGITAKKYGYRRISCYRRKKILSQLYPQFCDR